MGNYDVNALIVFHVF